MAWGNNSGENTWEEPSTAVVAAAGQETKWGPGNNASGPLNQTEDDYFSTIAEEPPTTPLHIAINLCLGVICLVGLVLCARFIHSVRRGKGSEISSRWCLCHVIAVEMAVSHMQLFGVAVYISRLIFSTDNLFYKCTSKAIQISLSYWSTLPSMLSLLVLALDQFISVAFPLQTRVKTGERLKKAIFSLVIWGPSTGFTLTIFAILWPVSGDFSCVSVMSVLAVTASSYSTSVLACVCLNVVVYCALFLKILVYMARNKFKRRNAGEVFRKQRRLIVIFSVVCLTTILFWLPPFVFLSFTELCMSVDTCRAWRQDIWVSLVTLYQSISIFDPLFLAWRFPAIGDLYFCRKTAALSRSGT